MAVPYNAPLDYSIAKLPVELLVRIMRSGLDFSSQHSLSRVSRGFRDARLIVPEFWSTIVPKFPLREDQLQYWSTSITNSGSAPLDIKLTIRDTTYGIDPTQGFLPLFLELVVHVARWRTFVFVTDFPRTMKQFLTETMPVAVFPQLESLKLACAGSAFTRRAAWSALGDPGESSPVVPRLRDLALWNVWACNPRGVLTDLVDLEITGDLIGISPPIKEIVAMLNSSPNLETLSITILPPSLSRSPPPPTTNEPLRVVLPKLRSLTFRGSSRTAGVYILPLLHLPSLERLHLENSRAWTTVQAPEDYSSVIRIITQLNMPRPRPGDLFPVPPGPQWSHWKLKEVTLSWVMAAAEPLFEWLSFMHELATLRVRSSNLDPLRVLRDGKLCPLLQTLHVEGPVDSATRNELERVMRTRPDLDVFVEATPAGSNYTSRLPSY